MHNVINLFGTRQNGFFATERALVLNLVMSMLTAYLAPLRNFSALVPSTQDKHLVSWATSQSYAAAGAAL